MRQTRFHTLLLSGAVCLATSSAFAQNITPEEAAQLQSLFDQRLTQAMAPYQNDKVRVSVQDGVMVEPKGAYYAVTLPAMTADYGAGKLEMGNITANVTPDQDGKQWAVAYMLPEDIFMNDPQGEPLGRIHIGAQRGTGIWHEDFGNFVRLDAALDDVEIVSRNTEKEVNGKIGSIAAQYNLKQQDNGMWSGPTVTEIRDLDLNSMDGETIRVGRMGINTQSFDMNFDVIGPAVKELQSASAMMSSGGQALSETQQNAVLSKLMESYKTLILEGIAGGMAQIEISDVAMKLKDESSGEMKEVALKELSYGVGLRDLRQENSDFSLSTRVRGIESTAGTDNGDNDQLLPENVALNIQADDVPVRELIKLAEQNRGGSPAMLMFTLPQILSQSGTQIRISDTGLSGEVFDATLEGVAKADNNAIYKTTVDSTMRIRGLDDLAQLAQDLAAKETDPAKKQALQKQLQTIAMLQMFGQQTTDEEGRPIRVYDFDVTPQGKMLLNGADLSALKGMR